MSVQKNPSALLPKADDVVVISERDSPSHVLVSSVPVLASSSTTKFQLEEHKMLLRSSTHNLSGYSGYRFYSLPILADDLSRLLFDAQADLHNYNSKANTNFYQFNTTKWTFSVIAPNTTVYYASICAIVNRFLKLNSLKIPSAITTTRVGVLLNGTNAVADVIITPYLAAVDTTYEPFAMLNEDGPDLSSAERVEIFKVGLYGSTCSYERINETAALSLFSDSSYQTAYNLTLLPRSLESQVLARVGQTAFALSVRIWHRALEGHPVQVEAWMVKAIVLLALTQLTFTTLLWGITWSGVEDPDLGRNIESYYSSELDTGFFALEKMTARLIVRITKRDTRGRTIRLRGDTWREILGRLAVPLEGGLAEEPHDAWAMEGKLFGPENGDEGLGGDRNNTQIVIGSWQLWVGESGVLNITHHPKG